MAEHNWRPVIAALVNPDSRTVFARMCLGELPEPVLSTLPPKTAAIVAQMLMRAGLLHNTETGLAFDPTSLRTLLARDSNAARDVSRYLAHDGHILSYPANKLERGELLRHVAERTFEHDRAYTESAVNEALKPYQDDVVVLRRYLVDYGILDRTPDGAEYHLTTPSETNA